MSVPTGLTQLVAFVLLVTPGVAFQFMFARWRPDPEQTALEEVAGVIAVSAVASTTVLVLALLALPTEWFEALRSTARAPQDASQLALVGLGATAIAGTFVAVGLAVGVAWLLTRKSVAPIYNEPVWTLLFDPRKGPDNSEPYIVVKLRNGHRYLGLLVAYTTAQVPLNERDIVLGPPLYVRWAGAPQAEALTGIGRVSVAADLIESINISYYPAGTFETDSG